MTLLGDAALPIGSNSASQAILDARILTREIQRHGPEQVTQMVGERPPAALSGSTTEELESAAAGYKRLAEFDKDTLNSRRSIVDAKKAVIPPQAENHASDLNPYMGRAKLCHIVDWTSNRGMGPVLRRNDGNEGDCRRFRPGG